MIECYFLALISIRYILKKKALVAVKAKGQNHTNGDFFSNF